MLHITDLDDDDDQYFIGKFLGKGGFAECYEVINCKTDEVFAVKIISKLLLIKDDLKEKISQEIAIHKTLNHKNIVKFHRYFEDEENIYILLELCKNKSLVELQKQRKHISVNDCRIIMKQIVSAVKYLHQNGIIHRDLKLSNVLLDENNEVKVSDFGLATLIEFIGEKKKAICGTPNYISPEMLSKKGHSFEVDAWSLGCIMYTLLVGSPPFETSTVEQTYSRIARNAYCIPASLSGSARDLIKKLLHPDPSKRMKIKNIENHEFFRTDQIVEKNDLIGLTMGVGTIHINEENGGITDILYLNKEWSIFDNCLRNYFEDEIDAFTLSSSSSSSSISTSTQSISSPSIYYVNKWVDFTEKYGLSYELNDSNGILFNDDTRLIFLKTSRTLIYMVDGKDGQTTSRTIFKQIPNTLQKKFLILHYFMQYMKKHLSMAGLTNEKMENTEMTSSSLVFVVMWYRCESSIMFLLSNKAFQINFFTDHSKLLIDGKSCCYIFFDGQTRKITESKISELNNYKLHSNENLYNKMLYCKMLIAKMSSLNN